MPYRCPACQRTFDITGFCPYDGRPLVDVANADRPTLTAQADPGSPTEREVAKLRAVSAHEGEGHAAALDAFRGGENEYDRLVGETLDGRYFILRKIGEGGMGVVFAARHAVIERPLAIKVLKREVMRDTATIQRFVQEAKAASRIGHPNIVDVTDFGTTPEGMTYSVMEFVDGNTLKTTIKHAAPLPAARAIRIAAQLARALGAAHDKGIVHRDLKPENVFLIDRDDRPDFVKIVDFGIAKVQPASGAEAGPRLTRAGSVFGTPEYMAPEQAAGRGDTDRRVDIYALGTILYEMIVGKTPHKSTSVVGTIAMQMLDPIVPPSKVNPDLAVAPELEAVIMKALAKPREDRYQTMGEFLGALEALPLDAEPVLAALPPGADPDLTPSLPPAPLQPSGPRRAKPETRQLHEPEFAAAGSLSLQHAFEARPGPDFPRRRRRRRWPILVAGAAMIVGGACGVILIAMRLDQRSEIAMVRDAAPAVARDAAIIVPVAGDAAPAGDAAVVIDAGSRAIHRHRDAGAIALPHPTTVRVEVLTTPGDAHVFIDNDYRGPTSTTIEEPYGVTRTIECRNDDFVGSITLVFDGSRSAIECSATTPIPPCVPGIKNPYRNCPNSLP